jgi:hypothetical protein
VSAVSLEIAEGTRPVTLHFPKSLSGAFVAGLTLTARQNGAGVQEIQPGQRRDARREGRGGERVVA